MHEPNIEVIARAIITDETGSKMLFCAAKNQAYFYLPGGHLEFGEKAKAALIREFYEETGADISSAEFRFAGTSEHVFMQDGVSRHEVNLYFEVANVFSGEEEIASLEEDISFRWISLGDILELPVFPAEIVPSLSRWQRGNSIDWRNEEQQ